MGNNADQVIEVLNENPVGQVNSISNFKSRSKYWGSKYGVADRGVLGYNILVEANHQRWWCPKYTNDTNYHIGSGIPTTGQVIECGTWRCDTFSWWAFYSQGLMLYDQRHSNAKSYIHNEQPLLKAFFAELLDSKSLNSKMDDDAIRGFIDTHSAEEIMANRDKIDKWLPATGHYSSIMLKYTLVHKSKDLQLFYIKSIVKELREANNSDLDSYLFGPLSMGYQGSGKNLLKPESKKVVVEYLKLVQHKYTPQGIKANPNDSHRATTAPYYFELIKNMGI